MAERRSDIAVVVVAGAVLLMLVGGGLYFVIRQAGAAAGAAEEARLKAAEMQSRIRADTLRAEQDSLRAETEAGSRTLEDLKAENERLRAMLEAASKQKDDGQAVLRQSLAAAVARLEEPAIKDNPAAAAAIRSSVGMSYLGLGEAETAVVHLRIALDLRIKAHGEAHPQVASDRDNLARAEAALVPK
jgi:hypothetical protein